MRDTSAKLKAKAYFEGRGVGKRKTRLRRVRLYKGDYYKTGVRLINGKYGYGKTMQKTERLGDDIS